MNQHMTKAKLIYLLHLRIQRNEEEMQRARVMGLHNVIAQLKGKEQAYREVISLMENSTALAQLSYYEGFDKAL